MEFFVKQFQVFLLVMVRLTAMITVAPFFSSGIIPMRVKGVLTFLITIVIFPVISAKIGKIPTDMGAYSLMILSEVAIGLFIGFMVSVIFVSFQLAGQYFAVQIGFGISEVLDPVAQVSVPLIGQLKNLIGLLVFLAMEGHHFLLNAIYKSYALAPVIIVKESVIHKLLDYMLYSFSGMFLVALKIAFPIIGTVFLVSISMGVLAKAAPQMNILMLGFPFKIMVAFGVFFMTAPLVVRIMQVALERTFGFVSKLLVNWPL